jgi:hypothetical protein
LNQLTITLSLSVVLSFVSFSQWLLRVATPTLPQPYPIATLTATTTTLQLTEDDIESTHTKHERAEAEFDQQIAEKQRELDELMAVSIDHSQVPR